MTGWLYLQWQFGVVRSGRIGAVGQESGRGCSMEKLEDLGGFVVPLTCQAVEARTVRLLFGLALCFGANCRQDCLGDLSYSDPWQVTSSVYKLSKLCQTPCI